MWKRARHESGTRDGRLATWLRRFGACWCWCCVLVAAACSSDHTDRPNVILVSIDTLRADALGSYGGVAETPALDALAAQGVLFERAYAPTALTAPSHTSLLTGTDPLQHGVVRNGLSLSQELELVGEAFQEAGYVHVLVEEVWNTNDIVDEKGTPGSLLKGLLGYNGNPSLLEVLAYPTYLGLALAFFVKPSRSAGEGHRRRGAAATAG